MTQEELIAELTNRLIDYTATDHTLDEFDTRWLIGPDGPLGVTVKVDGLTNRMVQIVIEADGFRVNLHDYEMGLQETKPAATLAKLEEMIRTLLPFSGRPA